MELAKALHNEGASVFGWDIEWNMNYTINRYTYGGSALFYRLNSKGGKMPGKIVVLAHDIGHRCKHFLPQIILSKLHCIQTWR